MHLVPSTPGVSPERHGVPPPRDTSELQSELGFGLRAEDSMLRLIDGGRGVPIPTRAEAVEAERDRADNEKLRADALESEVERLKALLQKHGDTNGSGS